MDSNTNNFGSRRRDLETGDGVDASDSESVVTVNNRGHFSVKIDDYLDQLMAIRQEIARYRHENLVANNELKLEEDLKQAKAQYLNEVTAFEEKVKSEEQTLKRKSDLVDEIDNSLSKLMNSFHKHLALNKQIEPELQSIGEVLTEIEEIKVKEARECAISYAELANKVIDLYGYADQCADGVDKIVINGHRRTNDIAMDCFKVFRFLMQKGPYDPFEGQMIEVQKDLSDLDMHLDELKSKKEEQDRVIGEVDKKLAILVEKKSAKDQTDAETKMVIAAEEEAFNEKLVSMIRSNLEKHKKFVEMGKKIANMREWIKVLPELEQKLVTIEKRTAEKNKELTEAKNRIEEIRETIRSKKKNIEAMEKRAILIDSELEEKAQEIRSKTVGLEIEFRDLQAKARESLEARDKAQEEHDLIHNQLEALEEEFHSNKEQYRQRKVEKKKNLRETRKLKDQLTKQLTLLTLSVGVGK